jgi:hypothetical protein
VAEREKRAGPAVGAGFSRGRRIKQQLTFAGEFGPSRRGMGYGFFVTHWIEPGGRVSMRKTIRVAGALLLLLSAPDIALAKGMSLKQLQGLLSDLGYETTDRGDDRIAIEDQGRFKRDIDFALNDDMTVLNIDAPLTDVAEDKKDRVPMEALLKANDSTGPFAYAIVSAGGKGRLDLEGYFDAATVNKQMLRRTIDALLAAEDAGEPLWNDEHWTAAGSAAAPKSLDEAKAAFEEAWVRSPLRIEHGTFITEAATAYGSYDRRPDNIFKPGETLVAYMEPEGYSWKPIDGDLKGTEISVDMLLSDKHGTVIADRKSFLSKSFKAHGNFMGLFFNVNLHLNGLTPGDYAVRYTLHDLNSDKSAEITLPFRMASATTGE